MAERSAAQEAADAILEVIEGKLLDCPLEWTASTGAVTHRPSGLTIERGDGALIVTDGTTRFKVEGDWSGRLLQACQIRNGRALLAHLCEASGE